MSWSFQNLFGRSGTPAKDAGGRSGAKTPAGAGKPAAQDFRAVSINPGVIACDAARKVMGKRFLMRKAPALPLSDCTMTGECKCRFRRTSDRREGERRLEGSALARAYSGAESRKRYTRRTGR